MNAFACRATRFLCTPVWLSLADNQDQLASVIGLGIVHVRKRHDNERMSPKLGAQMGISLVPQSLRQRRPWDKR
ncbi:MAG: hypothetical protein IPI17_16975 [Nitrosomonas sp.]|nr:hypothetical protein [Nitrosomonas sp.]